jgi:predicted ester cyclase
MSREAVLERLRRDAGADELRRIRDEWKRHAMAEDRRDLPGLLSTLTEDCVYELVAAQKTWEGHAGAARFYTELLAAIPDIAFELTDIVVGPQGVCEEATVTGTHRGPWLGRAGTGGPVTFRVAIFFPWDPRRGKFAGEKIYVHPESILGP